MAWRWKSPDMAIKQANPSVGPSFANESTPLMVGGRPVHFDLAVPGRGDRCGHRRTKWVYDPKIYENGLGMPANLGWLHRGVAYWRNGDDDAS